MVEVIPERLRKTWEIWNIRGVILVSLLFQIILFLGAPMRKRTGSSLVILLVWSSYFLAEWAATFALGLITNSQSSRHAENSDLYAFWASFLLFHHGGPDTITAFEENELWLRHLVSLINQVGFTFYVLLQTLPKNNLWLPTSLIFFAGIIKYAERTRSLYLVSWGKFPESMLTKPDPGPDYVRFMQVFSSKKVARLPTTTSQTLDDDIKQWKSAFYSTQPREHQKLDDFEVVKYGYHFFKIFKGLIVDLVSYKDLQESRVFFTRRCPEDALQVLEVELNFIYDILYTKVFVVQNLIGYFFRLLTFASVLVSLGIFFSLDCKNGLDKFDIRVTYSLLLGAFSLEAIALFKLIFSDSTIAFLDKRNTNPRVRDMFKKYLKIRRSRWSRISRYKDESDIVVRITPVLFRRWSESLAGFNLITYCLKKLPKKSNKENDHWCLGIYKNTSYMLHRIWRICRKNVVEPLGAKDFIDEWKYAYKIPFTKSLWEFIFAELLRKSREADKQEIIKTISSARGAYVLEEYCKNKVGGEVVLFETLTKDYIENVTFDESLLLWHIATELCYHGSEVDHDIKAQPGKQELSHHGSDVDHSKKGQPDEQELNYHGNEINHQTKAQPVEHELGHDGSQVDHDKKADEIVDHKFISKLVSDYMLYLLVMKPTMMSDVAGIGDIRYRDTCAEAKGVFRKMGLGRKIKDACENLLAVNTDVKPIYVKGDKSKSICSV